MCEKKIYSPSLFVFSSITCVFETLPSRYKLLEGTIYGSVDCQRGRRGGHGGRERTTLLTIGNGLSHAFAHHLLESPLCFCSAHR